MNQFLDIPGFISDHITHRKSSYFAQDIIDNKDVLTKSIYNKSVLVIGGAGTIGSSFIKAILKFEPQRLTVVDYSENGLTELTRDLRSSSDITMPHKFVTYPFDFGGDLFEKMFLKNEFDIVACFAAHKHVRSEKDHLAIEAMINNNVFNTNKLLKLLLLKRPEHFFSVSTDKAANPVNIMGASKMLMEKVLMSYSKGIKITTARFANVAFSNGSLLYGFIERMMKKQPLSSPLDVKRYFVSPEESGQLCMLACILGNSGEVIFPLLRENQMITFSSIAEKYLEIQGLSPDYCKSEEEAKVKARRWKKGMSKYPVHFTESNTSGEKLYEEFYTATDEVDKNTYKALGVVKNTSCMEISDMEKMLISFKSLFKLEHIEKSDIVQLLKMYISNFNHIETGKSLDSKM